MELSADQLERPPEEVARRIALGQLDEAREACRRLQEGSDEEALHDARVAIRRLRSTLRQWRPLLGRSASRKRRNSLRELQRSTGEGRDAEVALAWLRSEEPTLKEDDRAGFAWLEARLARRHRECLERSEQDLPRRFARVEQSLRDRLPVMHVEVNLERPRSGPVFAAAAGERARATVHELARRLGGVDGIAAESACHNARLVCKRLRYLLEPLRSAAGTSGVVKQCKRLQDLLGDLNDAHVLNEELGRALQAAAAERALRLHELTREDPAGLRSAGEAAPADPIPGLLELTRRVERHARRLFASLERDWLSGGIDKLLGDTEELALRLESLGSTDREIERKYLLDGLPDFESLRRAGRLVEVLEIDQGWLPGRRIRERIRRTRCVESAEGKSQGRCRYTRTIKLGRGIERLEIEEDADEAIFDSLWPLTEGCRVRKRRYRVAEGNRLWEIDEFTDRSLVLAEVELDDAQEKPLLPGWIAVCGAREVTEDPSFTNLKLAR